MSDLISRSALIKKMSDTNIEIMFDLPVEELLGEDVDMDDFCTLLQDAIQAYRKLVIGEVINNAPTIEAEPVVPLSEIYRVIAGHSDYHGDNILSALTCIAEGKEVKPIKPLEE